LKTKTFKNSTSGLPDGLFSNKKSQILGNFWIGLVNVGIFYDHLEYYMAIWYNLWASGIVCGHLLYFSQFGMFGPRKIWQLCSTDITGEVTFSPSVKF
jgi:hypothetical protein